MLEYLQGISHEEDIRKAKIEHLKKEGTVVFKEKFDRTHTIKDARTLEMGTFVAVCGRVVSKRVMGGFSFMVIADIEGKIQITLSKKDMPEENYQFFKDYLDLGDFIGVRGELWTTQTGEISVSCKEFELLSKASLPLPEKFHGLTDIEQKYRERNLDLVMSEESRTVFLKRLKLFRYIRRFLDSHNFYEVETPILQTCVGGASAKPFLTHHNALDIDMNLRIAPEISLKKLIAGGFDRVYEIAKCFRNEGMDATHLQEFTQVEWYASYWNFEDNIKFFTEFIKGAIMEVNGSLKLMVEGVEIDFEKPFEKVDYVKTLNNALGIDILNYADVLELKKAVIKTKLFGEGELEQCKSLSQTIDYMYKRKIRPNLIQPTILYNYPACLMPLARRNDEDDKIIDAFQCLVCGNEICKAYSELVDPFVQRKTFEEQLKAKAQGDDETMDMDEEFLLAMEHGMPPISGLGCGLDRLMMLLTGQPTIRDIVFFPTMKPLK